MPRLRPGDLTIVLLAGAAMIVLAALGAAGTAGAEATGTGSSFSTRPDGGRAAFLTLQQLGYAVERSHEPLAAIAADPRSSVLVLASPRLRTSEQDRRALAAYVEAGGVVLATGLGGAAALGGQGEAEGPPREPHDIRVCRALARTGLTADAPNVTMGPETTAPALGDRYEPAYSGVYRGREEVVVLSARIGAGQAVWWAGSTPLTNGAIADAGNLELLVNVVGSGDRVILWDEHYHGYARSLWSYAAATPLPWAGAQAALLALAALLTWSRRPGPVRPRVVDPRTSPMEFVETMGGLYERAGVAQAAVVAARRRARRLLALACGVTPDTPDDELAAAAASRVDLDAGELADLLHASRNAAADPDLDAGAALPLVQRLQALQCRPRGTSVAR